ncbi:DUF2252 domain-containing protein [bacterium]|nr:DUF2252 domain-containing protein [bacterium]
MTVQESGKNQFSFAYVPRSERYEMGKRLRKLCPRSSHAQWKPPANRADPVDLVISGDRDRIPKLIPLRHGRMGRSPFTFYRGAALNMATDLSVTPVSGMTVQACGDAHLCNFGGFATPERNVIFSINDLDETLPAPWEWDLKRLAASFVIACRNNNLKSGIAYDAVLECVRSYRENMMIFSEMRTMELWHYSLGPDQLISRLKDPELRRRGYKRLEKEQARSIAEDIFPQIVKGPENSIFIKDELPSIFHWESHTPGEVDKDTLATFERYKESLPPGFNHLLSRYQLKDVVIKVVGVGSVGTACWVVLLMTGDGDPLFIQAKEARKSVLEAYAGKSVYPNNGQRIVYGYRLLQPFSDPFLGWTTGQGGRDLFFRQLRDIKISIKVETFGKTEMLNYADWCGQALALSHARTGDAAMLSGYMGSGDVLDKAVAEFSFAYADQNEQDYASFMKAVKSGKIEAELEE